MTDVMASSFARIELLTDQNYDLWKIKVSALIKSRHLFDEVIVRDEPRKVEGNEESVKNWETWSKKNDEVMGIIILTLSNEQILASRGVNNAKELWDLLKRRHEGINKNRLVNLKIKLAKLELMNKESIDDFLTRARGIICELHELGAKIEEEELIQYVLNGLPRNYNEVATALLANQHLTYEHMRENLLRFERRQNLFNSEKENNAYKVRETKKLACYFCGKLGHIARNCWHKKGNRDNVTYRKNDSKNEFNKTDKKLTDVDNCNDLKSRKLNSKRYWEKERVLVANETRIEDDDRRKKVWYLDSGCTTHMTSEIDLLRDPIRAKIEIETAESGRKIYSDFVGKVKGYCDNELGNISEIVMERVLHVPHLNTNLLSAASMVKRNKKIVLDNKGVRIYDTYNDLVANGTFDGNNFIFEMTVETGNNINENNIGDNGSKSADVLCFKCENVVNLWHRRFCHMNRSYLEELWKKQMVRGLSDFDVEKMIVKLVYLVNLLALHIRVFMGKPRNKY